MVFLGVPRSAENAPQPRRFYYDPIFVRHGEPNDEKDCLTEFGHLRAGASSALYAHIFNLSLPQISTIDLYSFTTALGGSEKYADHVHFVEDVRKQQAEFTQKEPKTLL